LSMSAGMARQERVALEASRAFSTAVEVGGAVVLSVPEAPDSPMLNRVIGLGIERPATEADVDGALSAIDAGVTFYVALTTGARPAELPEWLRDRGLEPGWGWMAFRRGVEDPPSVETPLRLVEVNTSEEAAAFARVVRVSYEFPEASEPRLAGLPDAGWLCWLAFDDDEAAGAGSPLCGGAGGLPQFCGDPSRASGQGRAERPARGAHPPRRWARLRRRGHGDRRAKG
jgi:hypothetical protein